MAQQVVLESVIRANLDSSGFTSGAQKLTSASESINKSIVRVVESQQRLTQSSSSVSRSIENLQQQLDRSYQAQQRYVRAVETINTAAERGVITQERKSQLLALAQQRYLGVAQASERSAQAVTNSSRAFSTLSSALSTVSRGIASLIPQFGALAGFGGIGAFVAALGASIQQAEQFERLALRTQAVLQATGYTAGFTADQIRSMAQRIASDTLATTRGVEEAAQKLLTFRSIDPEVFERTLRVAQDLAAVGFGTLSSAAVQLGKALEDPRRGLASLREAGVTFSQSQRELIIQLAETGRAAEAQRLILEQIERQVGGAGRAEARGLAGAYDALSQNVENFLTRIGNLGPLQAATAAINTLANAVAFLDRQVAQISGGSTPIEAAEIAVQRAQERAASIQSRLAQVQRGGASSIGRGRQNRAQASLRLQLEQAQQEVVEAESRLRSLLEEQERTRAEIVSRGIEERARLEREAAEDGLRNLRRDVDRRVAIQEQFNQRMMVIERARRAGISESELQPLIRAAEKARDEALKSLEKRESPKAERTRIDALREQISLLEVVGERDRFIAQEVMKAKAGEREEVERLAGALFDLKKARDQEEETARLAAQVYEQTRTPYERYIQTLEKLARVREELAKTYGEEQAIQVIERASQAALQMLEKAEKQKEKVDDVAKSLGLTFESAFENAIVRGEKFSNVLKSIEQDLLRLGTRKLVTEPLMGLFNSLVGGIFGGEGGIGGIFSGIGSWLGGLFMHRGGLVGDKGVPQVLVNPALFAGAPRFHNGLMPDEFPAILQRGEMVIPRDVVNKARKDIATDRTINITVNVSGGPDMFRHSRGQIAAEMARELQRANRNL